MTLLDEQWNEPSKPRTFGRNRLIVAAILAVMALAVFQHERVLRADNERIRALADQQCEVARRVNDIWERQEAATKPVVVQRKPKR